jgi:NAD(P)-dependent dehydrogenase (short-subunit alcohol dehydrogenase family)
MSGALSGKVALVAGATRGAGRGIATMLGAAGATVYVTGRSTRATPGTRPETIEETAERVSAAGGVGVAVRVDHTVEAEVAALRVRLEGEQGRLDVLVNDVWGGDELMEWGKPFWALDTARGLLMQQRAVHAHLITSRHLVPLMVQAGRGLVVEVIDGDFPGYRGNLFYDLAKSSGARLAYAMSVELYDRGVTALAVTPGFLRSEAMLERFGVTEATWRDGAKQDPHFIASETPAYVGRAVAALAADPHVGQRTGRAFSSWGLARAYGFTDVDGRQPHWDDHLDAWVEGRLAALERGEPVIDDDRALLRVVYFQRHLDPSRRDTCARLHRLLGLGYPPP